MNRTSSIHQELRGVASQGVILLGSMEFLKIESFLGDEEAANRVEGKIRLDIRVLA